MLLEGRAIFLGQFLLGRTIRPAFHSPHMRPRGIPDDAMQPGRKGRATLELAQFPESQEESLLHNVFAILWVAKHLSGCSFETGHTGCEELIQFSVIHVDGKKGWLMESRTGNALIFD